MLLEHSLSCFFLCFGGWLQEMKKQKKSKAVTNGIPDFSLFSPKVKCYIKDTLDLSKYTQGVYLHVPAFNFGSNIGLYWLVLYSDMFNIGIGNLRPGPEIWNLKCSFHLTFEMVSWFLCCILSFSFQFEVLCLDINTLWHISWIEMCIVLWLKEVLKRT